MILLFAHGTTMFWIFGLILTLWVGPAQSSSRAFMARVAPVGREGEMFGLYATTGRAASFLAPGTFRSLLRFVLRPRRYRGDRSRTAGRHVGDGRSEIATKTAGPGLRITCYGRESVPKCGTYRRCRELNQSGWKNVRKI